jgi:predicted  nucleic acid-binding Zn-ribbon protein
MFRCERCGTGFNPTVATVAERCPRCRIRGVEARLSFRLFEPAAAVETRNRDEEEDPMAEVIEMWVFSIESGIGADPTQGIDVTGFGVEALDGSIGKVDEATHEAGAHRIVVDTGPWIFGKKVVLPAGVIDRVDPDAEEVYVHRTKEEIKNSPRFGEAELDESGREEVGSYYGEGGAGYRERQRSR